jgi:hypothetical protein
MKSEVVMTVICPSMAISGPAFALTGDDLLAKCSSDLDAAKEYQFKTYILGVVDGAVTLATSVRLLHQDSVSYPKLFFTEMVTPR